MGNTLPIGEMSLYITKSTKRDGVMAWSAVNSDTEKDLYGERMSLELFQDMIARIKVNQQPPAEYKSQITSDYWGGGMPYLSIAHYLDGNGKNVPGTVNELFIDGKQLKAKGTLHNSQLGQAVWKSLKKDETQSENKIRISIAFLDLAHKHGESGEVFVRDSSTQECKQCSAGVGDKIYTKGYLVHLALTRVPVNPRTSMERYEMTKKSISTKKEDAESIVGEIAEALEEKSTVSLPIVELSTAEETTPTPLEVKSDGEDENYLPYGGAVTMEGAQNYQSSLEESWRVSDLYYTFKAVANNVMDTPEIEDKASALGLLVDEFKSMLVAKSLYDEMKSDRETNSKVELLPIPESRIYSVIKSLIKTIPTVVPQVEKSDTVSVVPVPQDELSLALESLKNAVGTLKASTESQQDKLERVQPLLNGVADAITKSLSSQDLVENTAESGNNVEILSILKSLADKINNLETSVAIMRSTNQPVEVAQNRVPQPKSAYSVPNLQATQGQSQPDSSVKSIIRRSVGLR